MKRRAASQLFGFRLWTVDEEGQLCAWSHPYVWPEDRPAYADVVEHDWGRPGLHAYWDFHHCDDEMPRFDRSYSHWNSSGCQWVAGAVIGWGKCAIHTLGFRSEYAKCIGLYYSGYDAPDWHLALYGDKGDFDRSTPPDLQAVATRYGVPVFDDEDNLHTYAEEFGVQERVPQ